MITKSKRLSNVVLRWDRKKSNCFKSFVVVALSMFILVAGSFFLNSTLWVVASEIGGDAEYNVAVAYNVDAESNEDLAYNGDAESNGNSAYNKDAESGEDLAYNGDADNNVNMAVNGFIQTIRLTNDQLIIEVKEGYHFNGGDLILRDKTSHREYLLGIQFDNPDCAGAMTNRIVFSNLSLNAGNIYELTIPEWTVLYQTGTPQDDWINFRYNREYKTELIVEGSLTFPDVDESDWSYQYIKELTEIRVINGYDDGTFRPNGEVTRSEFAKIMTLALQIPPGDYGSQTFVDINEDDWEFVYIEAVKPYITGYYDGVFYHFRGSEPAVREDIAVALVKALSLEDETETANIAELAEIFSDYNTISPNLRKFVLIAYKNNLIHGYPDGTFGAQRAITRAETAALLSRIYRSDAMEKVTFDKPTAPDVDMGKALEPPAAVDVDMGEALEPPDTVGTDAEEVLDPSAAPDIGTGKILELPTTPHLRPTPNLMGWSTNGDFGILDDSPIPRYPGVVTNSAVTIGDFLAASEFVIEFSGSFSMSDIHVTNVNSPGATFEYLKEGYDLNYMLRQEGNKLIFNLNADPRFVPGGIFDDVDYAIYFTGIENFDIKRVYLVF